MSGSHDPREVVAERHALSGSACLVDGQVIIWVSADEGGALSLRLGPGFPCHGASESKILILIPHSTVMGVSLTLWLKADPWRPCPMSRTFAQGGQVVVACTRTAVSMRMIISPSVLTRRGPVAARTWTSLGPQRDRSRTNTQAAFQPTSASSRLVLSVFSGERRPSVTTSRAAEPRTVLEHLVWQRDRTYEELTADFDHLASEMNERATLSPRHLRRLASGERSGTTPVTRRVLHRMFGRPVEELLQPYTGFHATSSPLSVGCLPKNMSERELIAVAAQRARRFTLSNEPTVTAESVEQVYDDLRRLAVAYPQRPLSELLGDLVEVQDTVYQLLEQRQRPQQARELYLLAGVVGGLLAKASHDLAEPHAALTQARAAFVCADSADHNGLRAWLRGLQTMVAYWAGRHNESVRYARSGAEFASRSRGTVSVWLPASEARALAALGDGNGARTAIRRAEEAWNHVQPDQLDELGGICSFNRSRALYYAADALAWLPDQAEEAGEYAGQAVLAYSDSASPEWAFGDQAGSHADLAISRLALGELDGAVEAIAPVLQLESKRRINGIVHSVERVQAALAHSGLATDERAGDLVDEIESFTRTPAAALPR
jgi:hypothetical protein